MSAMSMSLGHDAGDSSDADSADGENWSGAQSWQGTPDESGMTGHETRQTLMLTLNATIIPRLLRSHRPDPVELPRRVAAPVHDDDVNRFVRDCIDTDPDLHEATFARLRALGHDLPTLYLDLVTPTARRIGRLWDTDDCTFPEVTLGLYRLQRLIHGLSGEFCANPAFRQPQHRILLAPMPGSHHTLGFYMLSQFFRRDGWSVCSTIEHEPADLVAAARADWYDVIALSVSCSTDLERLRILVSDIRQASLNPQTGIMIGGPLGIDEHVRRTMAAEAYSGDAPEALRAADRLVRERERPN